MLPPGVDSLIDWKEPPYRLEPEVATERLNRHSNVTVAHGRSKSRVRLPERGRTGRGPGVALGHRDPTVTVLWIDQKYGSGAALPADRAVRREIDVDAFGTALGARGDQR